MNAKRMIRIFDPKVKQINRLLGKRRFRKPDRYLFLAFGPWEDGFPTYLYIAENNRVSNSWGLGSYYQSTTLWRSQVFMPNVSSEWWMANIKPEADRYLQEYEDTVRRIQSRPVPKFEYK